MTTLLVDLAGEERELTIEEELTFGRDADLVVDTNRYLHRRLGVFRYQNEMWWLANLGSAIRLEIVDCSSPSRLTLSPGRATPLNFEDCWIRFRAGPSSYELLVSGAGARNLQPDNEHSDESTTIGATNVKLNHEQRLLLIALAESRFGSGTSQNDLPTNRKVADRLGWAITKYNRKLDNLCTKFARLGVPGVKGDLAGMANKRREHLVDHVINVGIVRPHDLVLLDEIER